MVVEVVGGLLASSLALLSDAAPHAHRRRRDRPRARRRPARRAAGERALHVRPRAARRSCRRRSTARRCSCSPASSPSRRSSACSSRPDVDGAFVVAVGLVGAAVNVAAAWALGRAERRSLNVEGARQHVLTDLYASLAAVAAGAVVLVTGFDRADGIAALFVAALMLRSGWGLLRDSGRVLLEAAPQGMDPQAIGEAMAARAGRRRGPRPARLGGHVGLPGARGARARPARRRLPRGAPAAAARARRALRDRPRDAPGRPRHRGRPAARDRAAPVVARLYAPRSTSSNPRSVPSTRQSPIVWRGWRRRSVGLPGLKI